MKLDARLAEAAKPGPDRAGELAGMKAERVRLLAAAMKPEARTEWVAAGAELARVTEELAGFPKPGVVFAGTVHYGAGSFRGTGAAGGKPRPILLLARGQVTQPGREVGPGALSALSFRPARFALPNDAPEGERRAALARWITDPENPLTWRSIDESRLAVPLRPRARGDAERLRPQRVAALPPGVARLARRRVPRRRRLAEEAAPADRHQRDLPAGVGRQSTAAEKVDADNGLLWRQNRRKLEAEAVRDAVLAVSGQLDLTMGGPGWQDFVIEHPEHSPHYEYARADPEDKRTWRRSIYRFIVRSQTQPWMTALDCADPSMRVDKRNESLSAPQALALLNNGFMVAQSRHFAERLGRERPDLGRQVERAYWLAFGRAPAAAERAKSVAFASAHGLPNLCRALLNLNEFVFAD